MDKNNTDNNNKKKPKTKTTVKRANAMVAILLTDVAAILLYAHQQMKSSVIKIKVGALAHNVMRVLTMQHLAKSDIICFVDRFPVVAPRLLFNLPRCK